MIDETGYFPSGPYRLAFACQTPSPPTRDVGVIFIHAAHGNRLGPHRMFVEIAQQLHLAGYPTFRFDLNGCGDSTGPNQNHDFTQSIADVTRAVRFFQATAQLNSVAAFAISRGAFLAFHVAAASNLSLHALILLSTPLACPRAAFRSFSHHLREYAAKLTDPYYRAKLFNRQTHARHIAQTLCQTIHLRRRYRPLPPPRFASPCPTLLIYGGCDPIQDEALKHYTRLCAKYRLPCSCHVIPHANHSFFHYLWKQQIAELTLNWLEKPTPGPSHEPISP